ncbi:MAG TPA: hypothetical protein DDW78_04650 [Treponema sp.]|nr:hypothetical protein [Treponema sp.]
MLSDGMQLMPEPLIRKQKCAGRKNPCSAHFFVSGRAWQLPPACSTGSAALFAEVGAAWMSASRMKAGLRGAPGAS